jgi:DNA-binding PadR family transcriptional regulator
MPSVRSHGVNATAAALLGLLREEPMTGGQLVAAASARFGAFFTVTRSQVYRELPVLEKAGLLTLGEKGPRASQQFVLTPAGRAAFVRWIAEGGGVEGLRSSLVLRLLHAAELAPQQRVALIDDARAVFVARLAAARSAARDEDDPFRKAVADFTVAHTRAMVKLLDSIPT